MSFISKYTALAKAANFHPATDINIERLIDGESVAVSQEPSGTGAANAIQIEFGPALGAITDPIQLLVNGSVKVNVSGLYRIKVSLQFGRTGSVGVSLLHFRASSVGNQLGRSLSTKLGNSNETRYLENDSWLNLVVGTVIDFEVMRDDSGNNSGGLFLTVPTNEVGAWNNSPSASIRIERFQH